MNEISILTTFLQNLFADNDMVNTISNVPTLEIDSNKMNIYPLVNVDLKKTTIEDQAIYTTLLITIVQQRDKRPVRTSSKILDDSNYIDNINETHSIAVKAINYLVRQNNTDNIEIESYTDLTILKEWSKEGLDGVQFSIVLSMHNRGSSC